MIRRESAAGSMCHMRAQRLCASSVMHDAKNTVNLILDFCKVLEYFWQMGPDWSATHVRKGESALGTELGVIDLSANRSSDHPI